MNKIAAGLALALPLLCALDAAQARTVRCTLHEGRAVVFEGPCDFEPDGKDGSFTLSSQRKGGSLTKGVIMVSVSMISSGVAEVRGLTRAGINSRWGEAKRSKTDGACWIGSDFQVCAK